jgi:hypothetical protein
MTAAKSSTEDAVIKALESKDDRTAAEIADAAGLSVSLWQAVQQEDRGPGAAPADDVVRLSAGVAPRLESPDQAARLSPAGSDRPADRRESSAAGRREWRRRWNMFSLRRVRGAAGRAGP